MFAKFSNESIVDQHMQELELGATFLAGVAGVCSTPSLIGWLDGRVKLDRGKQERLVAVCRALRAHAAHVQELYHLDVAYPLSFATQDVEVWKILLAREAGEVGPGWESAGLGTAVLQGAGSETVGE